MSIDNAVAASGIDAALLTPEFYHSVAQYLEAIEVALFMDQTQEKTPPTIQWQYQVPELGEGGSCSLFDQLAAQAYDLEKSLGGQTEKNQRLLQQVSLLVNFYRQHSSSDWFGIYQKRENLQGEIVLMKLAYYGAPSRAEFPLTNEFAAMSNNSSVGLSGKGRVINQVSAYRAAGGEYYTCDPQVNAEACLPVLNEQGDVLGIIDSETFLENTFTDKELALLIAIVVRLERILED